MSARVLDGRPLAATVRAEVAARASHFTARAGRPPRLVAVQVGDDPASVAYTTAKARAAQRCGLDYQLVRLPASSDTAAVVATVAQLGAAADVDAILVEQPLPPGCGRLAIEAAITPDRDVDGVTPTNQGRLLAGSPGPRPATALAVMALIGAAGVAVAGAEAVVVVRSVIVGKPVALLLLAAHATVTIAHSRTRDLAAITRRGDILVVAVGVPELIQPRHVRPGAIVIDVGTSWVGTGEAARTVGDVAYEAVTGVAGAITPVPGGVGPLTTAMVLRTAVGLAEARAGLSPAASAHGR